MTRLTTATISKFIETWVIYAMTIVDRIQLFIGFHSKSSRTCSSSISATQTVPPSTTPIRAHPLSTPESIMRVRCLFGRYAKYGDTSLGQALAFSKSLVQFWLKEHGHTHSTCYWIARPFGRSSSVYHIHMNGKERALTPESQSLWLTWSIVPPVDAMLCTWRYLPRYQINFPKSKIHA